MEVKNYLLFAIVLALLFVTAQNGCQRGFRGCTEEAKLCPDGSYVGRVLPTCEFANCPDVEENDSIITINEEEISLECNNNNDCILVNTDLNYSQCWAGYCGEIDYSLDNYVAVNKQSFESFLENIKPSEEECGPAPGCPVHLVNDSFVAECRSMLCVKVPKKVDDKENFCGTSTLGSCESDADCITTGCSGQVCSNQSAITTCEWRECYAAGPYGLGCNCVQGQCQWS